MRYERRTRLISPIAVFLEAQSFCDGYWPPSVTSLGAKTADLARDR